MAELAVVSVRKAKMQKYLEEGNKNAEIVLPNWEKTLMNFCQLFK